MARPVPQSALVLLATGLLLMPAAVRGDVLSQDAELVILGVPSAPAGEPPRGPIDLTLTWRVLEIFRGEPGSVSIAVRHLQLGPAELRSLASGERFIVLANPDAARPGRWRAPMPLRATPEAVDAFRRWSAPPDVRPPREVAELVAEVRAHSSAASPGPPREPSPARDSDDEAQEGALVSTTPEPSASSPAPDHAAATWSPPEVPEVEVVEPHERPGRGGPAPQRGTEAIAPAIAAGNERAIGETESPRGASVVGVARLGDTEPWLADTEPQLVDTVIGPCPAVDNPSVETEDLGPVRATRSSAQASSHLDLGEPPLSWQPALQPLGGPGLPPSPAVRPLGPRPSEREDLKKPRTKTEGDA